MVQSFSKNHQVTKSVFSDNYNEGVGEEWGVWTGGIGSTNVAMLVAVVTGGYHGMSNYRWEKDSEPLEDEVYPVIYPTSTGEYVCSVSIKKYRVFLSFLVTSAGQNIVHVHITEWSVTIVTVDGCDWNVQVPPCSRMVGDNNAETPYTFEIASQRLTELQPLKAKGKK